jgi:hypothetical protein
MRNLVFVLAFMALASKAQQPTWTWMKGDSLFFQPGVYGVQTVPSVANKPPATYEGLEWRDMSGNFWLYDNDDLWKFDPGTLQWTWMKGTQGIPSYPSYGVKGVSSPSNHPGNREYGGYTWVDNNNNLWLYGGSSQSIWKSDLWRYTIANNEWTWMQGDSAGNQIPVFGIKGVSAPTNKPPCLTEGSASWTDSNNNLWLFGGEDFVGSWNTLWKYTMSNNQWTWMSGDSVRDLNGVYGIKGVSAPANKPSSRWCYTKWSGNNTLWIFGGARYDGPLLNDLWRYDIGTNEWTWMSGTDTISHPGTYIGRCVSSQNRVPSARAEGRACWKDLNGNFWLYGGGSTNYMNDLWVYSPNINEWTWAFGDSLTGGAAVYGTLQIAAPGNNPGGRCGTVSWVDGFNNLWLFGGMNGSTMNDLWKFTMGESCKGEVIETRINEVDRTKKFAIYPLPFKDKFTVELTLTDPSAIKLLIRNLQGQLLYTTQSKSSSKHHQLEVDLEPLNLLEGIYVLDIYDGTAMVTRKVWKK